MIASIRHKGLWYLYERNDASRVRPDHVKKLKRILSILDDAEDIKDIATPGFDLHNLSGDLADFHSVKVNRNWRVIFRFEDDKAYDVDYLGTLTK